MARKPRKSKVIQEEPMSDFEKKLAEKEAKELAEKSANIIAAKDEPKVIVAVDGKYVEEIPEKVEPKVTVVQPSKKSTKLIQEVVPVDEKLYQEELLQTLHTSFEEPYFNGLKLQGLDVSVKGGWQKMFAHYLDIILGIKGKKVLDLGCAMGAQASAFADRGAKAIGLDISKYAISKTKIVNVEFICAPAWDLSKIEDNSIDLIYSMFMLNHVPECKIGTLFKEIARVCKKDAFIFMVFHGADDNTKVSDVLTNYSNEAIKLIADFHGLKDETANYHKKFMETDAPGWDFMRYYKWNHILLKKE